MKVRRRAASHTPAPLEKHALSSGLFCPILASCTGKDFFTDMTRAKAPHLREGNPRESTSPAKPAPENVAEVPPAPEPPAHLGTVARRYWDVLWEAGAEAYNRVTDAAAIDRYCSLQERRIKFLRLLETEGYTTVGSQGQTVAHPAAKLLSDVESKLTPLEDRLGLNPDSRMRLGIAAIETKSRLDKFLEGDT